MSLLFFCPVTQLRPLLGDKAKSSRNLKPRKANTRRKLINKGLKRVRGRGERKEQILHF